MLFNNNLSEKRGTELFQYEKIDASSQKNIYSYLSNTDAVNAACISKFSASFFTAHVKPSRLIRREFLMLIGFGQRTLAAELLNCHRPLWEELLTVNDSFTDCGGRQFEETTAFKYALWCRGRFTFEMLLPYLEAVKPGEAARQLEDLKNCGMNYKIRVNDPDAMAEWRIVRGEKKYDFNEILNPILTYISEYPRLFQENTLRQLESLWSAGVGSHQARLPPEIRQEMTRPGRALHPIPAFDEVWLQDEAIFDDFRTGWRLQFNWLCHPEVNGLGTVYAIGRGSRTESAVSCCRPRLTGAQDDWPFSDFLALKALRDVSERVYSALEERLLSSLNPSDSAVMQL